MKRRKLLISLISVAAAGCSGRSSRGSTPETTASPTRTPEKLPNSVKSGDLLTEFSSIRATDSVRVFDPDAEEITQVEPSRGMWVNAALDVTNEGGDRAEPPDISDFQLFADGRERHNLDSFHGIPPENIRDDDAQGWDATTQADIEEHGKMLGGGYTPYQLLYDVAPNTHLVMEWQADKTYRLRPESVWVY